MTRTITALTRRRFLSLAALSTLHALLPRPVRAGFDDYEEFRSPPKDYGRVISYRQPVRIAPDPGARIVRWVNRDTVIPLYAAVDANPPWPSNPTWYMIGGGYVHSGYVQPVDTTPNTEIVREVGPAGFWAEVSLPYAQGSWEPGAPKTTRRLYFETVYRVIDARADDAGVWWYRLADGVTYGSPGFWVPAAAMRPLLPEDLAPISPGRADKWMQITIDTETLVCYEGEDPVFTTRTASGVWGMGTPLGEFTVLYKRHARRMVGDDYDLPGVPFPVYLTRSGVAIHGTYWHNDYGRRHSHGCINIASRDARWIFRWVDPVANYKETTTEAAQGTGTPVVVVQREV
jgi:hypothetical protein